MKYVSTGGSAPPTSFSDAVLRGLAPDGGLYVPEHLPRLPDSFWRRLPARTLQEIGWEISRLFIDDIDAERLREVVEAALDFDAPLVPVGDGLDVLELFHGPTLAFKDFGARFMARIFAALRQPGDPEIVILTATSGDTGSAVAHGFLGVDGIRVCLLYPRGRVTRLQEQQLTTAGENVTALEVEATFDDCQRMVKRAFADPELNGVLTLSSANSINLARLLPQCFYYVYAVAQLGGVDRPAPIFSVPSGNFGNLTAGLIAQRLGMPVRGFLAATNVNDVVPEYLATGVYRPRPSKATISNAMDVGTPSNFDRIEYLFEGSHEAMRRHVRGASFTDDETRQAIEELHEAADYLMDPHTAVGYLAAREYQEAERDYFGDDDSTPYVVLATAHAAKFRDVIEPVIGDEVPLPDRLRECMSKEKRSILMLDEYDHVKGWLLDAYA